MAVLLLLFYPIHARDIAGIAWFAACAAAGVESSRRAERFRERHRDTPHKSLNAMWFLPAALLFPPGLVCLLVALTYAWLWLRVVHHSPHRWIYNAATVAIGYATASVFFHAVTGTAAGPPGLPRNSAALAACFAAGAIALAVNFALVSLVIALTTPGATARQLFGGPSQYLTESAAICLGVLGAAGYTLAPWLILAGVPVAALLQRTLLFSQLQRAAHTDAKTGLATAAWWHELASREVERALRRREEVSVLLADLDHFKRVNDTWGHLAGDAVLAAVASEFAGNLRTYDVAGRFGGEEFVVLLPGTGPSRARNVAERLRNSVAGLQVAVPTGDHRGPGVPAGQVTVSIGIAALPAQARDLTALLARADMALYAAKQAGRDLVCYLDGPGEESGLVPPLPG
ncbi:MAG TPA: GGDEF domain-containing protein [Streptosporangiaceae bacterium]|nr:GGDEF domain-containing protein [Streptosporangiaceae bacterium]